MAVLWTPNLAVPVAEPAYVGRHRAPAGMSRALPRRRMSRVEVECEGLMVALRHLGDGRTVDDAWALGEIDARDILAAQAVAS